MLDKPYRVGWYGCPVFLANIKQQDAYCKEGTHRLVVILMYFDARERGENVSMDDFDCLKAAPLIAFAKAEADAYAVLERAQGSIVPYCYGFYKVRDVGGELGVPLIVQFALHTRQWTPVH